MRDMSHTQKVGQQLGTGSVSTFKHEGSSVGQHLPHSENSEQVGVAKVQIFNRRPRAFSGMKVRETFQLAQEDIIVFSGCI